RVAVSRFPPSVAAAIRVELAQLTMGALGVAESAAVAGDPFDLDLAVAASDRPEEEVLEAMDLLLARDLVRQTNAPRPGQFRQPIVHRAVYASCPPSIRISSHRRVVEALVRRGAPASMLASPCRTFGALWRHGIGGDSAAGGRG